MKKSGFTLVELLAVVTLLGIILVIAVPKLSNANDVAKEGAFKTDVNSAISLVKMHYQNNHAGSLNENGLVYKLENNSIKQGSDSVNYSEGDLKLTGTIEIDSDGNEDSILTDGVYCYITDVGVFKITEGNQCNMLETRNDLVITLDLNGGESSQNLSGNVYSTGDQVSLVSPSKNGFTFDKWVVIKGNGVLKNNTLKLKNTNTTVYALWKKSINLTVNLGGGSSSQSLNSTYDSGDTIVLSTPTRAGYNFNGYRVLEGDSMLSGNLLTIGTTDTYIAASWSKTEVLFAVNLDGGESSQSYASNYKTGDVVSLSTPTKSGYRFIGWDIIGNSVLSGNSVTIGSSDTSLKALWGKENIITLNNKNATQNGSTSVLAISNSNRLDDIINPKIIYKINYNANNTGAAISKITENVEYTFNGWFSEENGGLKVIDENGNLVPNRTGYTDSNGNWIANDATLYAIWTPVSTTLATITKSLSTCGYSETSDGTIKYVSEYQGYTPTKNIELYGICASNSIYDTPSGYSVYEAKLDGYYKVELWGAQGGSYDETYIGGKGAYTSGYVYLNAGEKLYLYVGEQPVVAKTANYSVGGYNGGGNSGYNSTSDYSRGGGGATDVRYFGNITPTDEQLVWNSELGLNSRIMVAAGGGGTAYTSSYKLYGANGGTVLGINGVSTYNATAPTGGKQTTYGTGYHSQADRISGFGYGGGKQTAGTNIGFGGGGGSGYYGGALGFGFPGASGSSFISGYSGVNAITSATSRAFTTNLIHYSNKVFIDGYMESGVNEGNGKANIIYVGTEKPVRVNKYLNNVRYIKDCTNGSTANTTNHWSEIQAMKDGINLAKGKVPTGTVAQSSATLAYTFITDGRIDNITGSANFGQPTSQGSIRCVTIDLGELYDLDEIAVWHYYPDKRTYKENTTSVSSDGKSWISVINVNAAESENGKRANAYHNNDSILAQGMIPVKISNNGTVTAVSENDPTWYNYDNKEWANAVLVKETGVKTRAENGVAGTVINPDDILAYYVWIPRYSYKLWTTTTSNVGSEREIEIKFIDKDVKEKGTAIGSWYTHPAFTFDGYELNGIWVGKFETSADPTTNCYKTPSTNNCNNATTNPRILPNVRSIAYQTLLNQFQTALKFSGGVLSNNLITFSGNTLYGLTSNTDSHLMKDTEWGAVAYLAHSKYGINAEIRVNNYEQDETTHNTLTGCGASSIDALKSTTCDIVYGSASAYPQSTTGNISGIFDMVGGSWDITMSTFDNTMSSSGVAAAFLINYPKYFDIYLISTFAGDDNTNVDYCTLTTCGGRALYETNNWYHDTATFTNATTPWFVRGGNFNSNSNASNNLGAGIFEYQGINGAATANVSFRSVLINQ